MYTLMKCRIMLSIWLGVSCIQRVNWKLVFSGRDLSSCRDTWVSLFCSGLARSLHYGLTLYAMLPTKRDIVCVFVAVIQVSLLLETVARSSLLLYFVSTRGLLRHRLQTWQLWFPQNSLSLERVLIGVTRNIHWLLMCLYRQLNRLFTLWV